MSVVDLQCTEAEAKRLVRERDGHRCVDCGATSDDIRDGKYVRLQVHRLVPRSVYTVDGCVLVCTKCHKKRHTEMRQTADPGPHQNVRLSSEVLLQVKIGYWHVKKTVPDPTNFTLSMYIADCLLGKRDMLADYGDFVSKEMAKIS